MWHGAKVFSQNQEFPIYQEGHILTMNIGKYILHQFNWLGQYLIKLKTEPQIRRKCDRYGNSYWQIFNPVSGKFTLFGSEKEVRVWLEEHFN